MAKTTNAVATAKQSAISTEVDDFAEFAGAGMEDVTSNDILVPRLSILQALSPQLSRTKPEYIAGAEVGQIADVGMGEVFPDGVLFVPVHYEKAYIEWAPRSSGKGLVEVHGDASILDRATKDDKGKHVLSNGNYIAETAQWYGINLSAGRRKCYIPMTSTQLRRSRKWMSLAMSEKLVRGDGSEFTAPLFYRAYELSTAMESNSEGEWGSWVINRGPTMPELDLGFAWQNLKTEAIEFRDSLVRGEARADTSDLSEGGPSQGGNSGDEGAM